MKFFVPGTSAAHSETAYRTLFDAAKDQLRTPISEKRIFSLRYIHDKRTVSIEVGEPHPHHPKYQILAILESHPHIVLTRDRLGKHGPTIMVANAEITEVVEFDTV